MTCSDAIHELISHRGDLPASLARHLDGCPSCRQLARSLGQSYETNPIPGRLDHIKSALLADLRPVTPLASPLALLGMLLLISLVVVGAGAVCTGLSGWQGLTVQLKVSIFAPLLIGASLLGIAVVLQMAPGSSAPIAAIRWSSLAFALLITVVAVGFERHNDPRLLPDGLGCFRVGTVYAVASSLLCWLVIRRGAMLHYRLAAATSGAFAGFLALAGSELRCPNPNGNHILICHLPLVVFGALASLAAVQFLAWVRRFRAAAPQLYTF